MLAAENLPWWRHNRPWGFRFSLMDAIIVVGGALLTFAAWPIFGVFSLCIPFLVFHFFLFCNTFRIGGERSLIWVASFLLNAFLWTYTQSTTLHVASQLLVTLLLIVNCVLGRNYHGLWCEWINPSGYRKGALTEGAFTRRVLIGCKVPRPLIELLIGRKLTEFDQEIAIDE